MLIIKYCVINNYNKVIKLCFCFHTTDDSDEDCNSSQYGAGVQSSKDTLHVLKLAAILHILNDVLRSFILGVAPDLNTTITSKSILRAQKLHYGMSKQKGVYIQVICKKIYYLYLGIRNNTFFIN